MNPAQLFSRLSLAQLNDYIFGSQFAVLVKFQQRYQSPIANDTLEISASPAPHPPLTSPKRSTAEGVAFSFRIPAGTGSKHLYSDETSGDVDLPVPSQIFPSRTVLTCGFRRNKPDAGRIKRVIRYVRPLPSNNSGRRARAALSHPDPKADRFAD